MSVLDIEGVANTTASIGIGAGLHATNNDQVSTYVRAGYITGETKAEWDPRYGTSETISVEFDGHGISSGIRASVYPKLDFTASVSRILVEDFSTTTWGAGFLHSIGKKLALGAGLSSNENATGLTTGERAYFEQMGIHTAE